MKFKEIFKRSTKEEGKDNIPAEIVIENKDLKNNYETEEDFGKSLENLKKLIDLKRELGGSLSVEEIQNITGMTLENLMNYLSGENFEMEGKEILDTLQFAISATEEKSDPSFAQRFSNNAKTKALIMALVLMGKFAPHTKAADNTLSVKDKNITKREVSFEKKTEPDNNYILSENDFEKDKINKVGDAKALDSKFEGNHSYFSLKFTDHFNTDSEKMIDSDKEQIEKDFRNFLSHLNIESAQKLLASEKVVTGFCDERETTKWGTNEKLADARVSTAADFLESILKDPTATSHLPKDISEKIQSMKIAHNTYVSNTGPEKGVKYITDLLNPETGKNFTAEEVSKLKNEAKNSEIAKAKLLELQGECRGVFFDVKVANEDIQKIMGTIKTVDLKDPVPAIKKWLGGYDNIIIIADNTPSMKSPDGGSVPSNLYIADVISKISSLDNVKKIVFGSFDSNGLSSQSYKVVSGLQEISKDIKDLNGRGNGNIEASFTTAIQALEKFEPAPGDKTVIKILTDEKLQDVNYTNYAKLKLLAEQKNAKIGFAYGDDKKQTLNEISFEKAGELLIDDILKKNGHPTTEEILKLNDGRTVEDHLAEIFAPMMSSRMSEIKSHYVDMAKNVIKYDKLPSDNIEKRISRAEKNIEKVNNKPNKYREALVELSVAKENKDIMEKRHAALEENAKILEEYGPELQKLADAYIKNHDKSLLSHPYFAVVAGLVKDRNAFLNDNSVMIGTDKFIDQIDLKN